MAEGCQFIFWRYVDTMVLAKVGKIKERTRGWWRILQFYVLSEVKIKKKCMEQECFEKL